MKSISFKPMIDMIIENNRDFEFIFGFWKEAYQRGVTGRGTNEVACLEKIAQCAMESVALMFLYKCVPITR